MQPNRYLAVRTHADDTWSHFYVVDTATGLAVTTHGSWGDAKASAELANEGSPTDAEWLKELFEFQLCDECGLDADRHEVCRGPFGLRFARCKAEYWQCQNCQRILPEDAIVGTCPDCRGNRLERVGT